MAQYKITDPQTKKTVTISGDREPTQVDAENIFKQAGLREEVTHKEKTFVEKAGDVIAPTLSSLSKGAGTFLNTFSPDYKASQEAQRRAEQMNLRVGERARQETDPEKKKLLVKTALTSGQNLADISSEEAKGFQETAGITDKQMDMSVPEYTARKTVGAGAEAASLLMPFAGKATQATRLGRVAQAGKLGTAQGALMSGGREISEGSDVTEVAKSTAVGGVIGGLTGIAVQGVFETPGAVKDLFKKVTGKARNKLVDMYKSTLKRNIKDQKFYAQAGGEDKLVSDAIKFDLPSTKNGIQKELTNYGSEFNRTIIKLAKQAEKQGKTANISKSFETAENNMLRKYNYDKQLQASVKRWFDQNRITYVNKANQSAKPISANKLRIKFDSKVGQLLADDISAMNDAARKAFATELRGDFKSLVGFEGKQAIRRYQLLAGLSEAMQKEPTTGIVEIAAAAASPGTGAMNLIEILGAKAIRSPGLKRKAIKELIKGSAGKVVPTAKKAVGNLLSPFTSNITQSQ